MNQIPIFDGHSDTLTRLYPPEGQAGRSFLTRGDEGHLDLPRAQEGGLVGGIFAIFTPPPPDSPEHDPYYGLTLTKAGYDVSPRSQVEHGYAKAFSDAVINSLIDLVDQAEGRIGLVRTYQDLEHNLQAGVFSIVLHLEGAAAIGEELSDLETYYEQGLRSLGLVWSRPNRFGHGVPFRFPHSPDTGPGLLPAGLALVRACNRLGILVDLAHLNEKGFWDAAGISDAPLVVSHAGVYGLCPSTRNLTDAQIDAIGASNGLLGIIFEPINTRPDGKLGLDSPLTTLADHIDYVAGRIGVDHVAFGSDFDGAEMPVALGDASGLPRLIQTLRDRGYDRASLEKIAYRNWFRVLRDTWRR